MQDMHIDDTHIRKCSTVEILNEIEDLAVFLSQADEVGQAEPDKRQKMDLMKKEILNRIAGKEKVEVPYSADHYAELF